MIAPAEWFARFWYVGLALTPLLVWIGLRRRTVPGRLHGVAVALVVALLIAPTLPALRDPGELIGAAQRAFRGTGLAPCLPESAAPPACLAYEVAAPWWIGGALVLCWYLLGCAALVRLRRSARPADPATRVEVADAARRLGVRPPAVVLHAARSSPMIAGLRRPVLFLPAGIWTRLDRAAREAILLHELAHVRRRDTATRSLTWLACAVYWWHPIVWWLRVRSGRDAELACDALAARTRPDRAGDLARALLEVERFARTPAPAAAMPALSAPARELAERLRFLAGGTIAVPDADRRGAAPLWFGVAMTAGWAAIQVAIGK